jgi:hypothetical protein
VYWSQSQHRFRGDSDRGRARPPNPNTDFVAIAIGGGHGLGLRTNGTIASWEDNTFGQCDVPAPNSGFTAIAAAGDHSLGLKNSHLGGCCQANGYCTVTAEEWCVSPSVWHGAGSVCVPRPCPAASVEPPAVFRSPLALYPNPGSGAVAIELGSNSASPLAAEVLDAAGRLVRRIPGTGIDAHRRLQWDGRDELGRETPGGIYFIRAIDLEGSRTATFVRTR